MLTSLSLGIFGRGSSSLLEGLDDPAAVTAPAGDLPPASAADGVEGTEPEASDDGAEQSEDGEAEQSTEPDDGETGSQQ